jgi:membrane protein YqaA with SNARE-associated domain
MPDRSLPHAPPSPAASRPALRRVPWQSIVLLAATLAITAAMLLIPVSFVQRLGNYGYLGLFVLTLLANATVVLPTPALGAALVAGRALDPWLVGLTTGIAAGLGEITGYMAGRGGSALIEHNRLYQTVERYVQRWGTPTIFVLAFVPGPFLDLAGIVAGSMRMPFWRFLVPCLLGKTLRYIVVAWIGRLTLS